ncbi:NTP transferase domain-containing protein [Anaerosporobacter faecicola]|uniref:NTP transferase domain-containing protein n=1 Tax=Anaerosporobacter faecicola TaxID=2718714 RepID=UPI001438C8F9|nr:NTP transferase domain-containing protein [Anaerosporobacter faecicola]
MNVDYVIVQAGGKGTRMEYLTQNKPKALVPINNLPMLFHLFRKYPEKKYVVIGDYKYDVLERYLKAFADVEYKLVNASGKTGTCAGIQEAMEYIPEEQAFMLIWSDLILPEEYTMPTEQANYIGIAKDFRCRWKYENEIFSEEPSEEHGVAGHFIFEHKGVIKELPESGELVRWLSTKDISFTELPLYHTKEYGLLSEYEKLQRQKCRPFNRLVIEGDTIIKEGIDSQGRMLAVREKAWYEKLMSKNFKNIPKIYSLDPLKMERIDGKNIYEYRDVEPNRKKEILKQVIDCLHSVQNMETVPSDYESYVEAYITKTYDRLKKVRDLVPFANDEYVTINGRKCRNVFYHQEKLKERVDQYFPKEFKLLHGDCTFSNMLLKEESTPMLIDPRGYFGKTEFYGDPAYDWVKLYYSIVGNYDQFNLKRFHLTIEEDQVELHIESNNWEDMEPYFFELLKDEVTSEQIKLLHAIIWLSLTTYAWEDYDSICGAFYNGLYYLEEAL